MKKILFILFCSVAFIGASAQTGKNGMMRLRLGPQFGAVQKKFFFGLEAGFEYSYVFRCRLEFSVIQKNNVNFLHGDTFRNGLLLGIKVPF